MKKFLLSLIIISGSVIVNAQPASEKLFKEMISNMPNYQSSPGTSLSLVFQEFSMSKPVQRTLEYGYNKASDKSTKVYKVIARFSLSTQTYNTATGKKYSFSTKEYRRPYDFYTDKNNRWVCVPVGLSKGFY